MLADIKVGILGAGGIAKLHTSILKRDPRVEIIGVADIDEGRSASLANEAGNAQPVKTLEELFELGVEAVYVTLPNTLHVDSVLKCLENNVNVFSEKPMATSSIDAAKIKEAVSKSKGIYNLGMNQRYAYVFKKVKDVIASGEFTPFLANIKLNRGELLNPSWTANPQVTGGFLNETPIHLLDLSRYLFGEVQTVKCEGRQNISETEMDTFAIMLTYESGTIANFVTYAHAGWSFPFESMEVYGKYSTITTHEFDRVMYSSGLHQPAQVSEFFQVGVDHKWGYVEENRLYIDAILNGTQPPVTAEDGYLTTRLVEAVYESAKTGEVIDFRQTLSK